MSWSRHSLGSCSSWLAMDTRLLSPPEIPGMTRPPITLWATWLRLSSAMTDDTCTGARGQRSGGLFMAFIAARQSRDEEDDLFVSCVLIMDILTAL